MQSVTMMYDLKTVQLKDGRQASFRSPKAEDGALMLENLKTISEETDFILRYPDEWNETIEDEARFLQEINLSDDTLMIVCCLNGRIIGSCTIYFNKFRKERHRASISLAVLKEYWGKGIGTLMIDELISVAKNQGVTQLELDYFEGNERARSLYIKAGFIQTGEIPNAIKLDDGRVLKEIHMIKNL